MDVIMMSGEWTICDGYKTKTMKIGNCTVCVRRPILPADEQKKREEELKTALNSFYRN